MFLTLTRRYARATAVLPALLLLSITALAQTAAPTPAQAVTSGSLKGRVVNESGQPLPSVPVIVRPNNRVGREQTTVTDNDGKFEISGLDPVPYQVLANLAGYITPPRDQGSPAPTYSVGESVRIVLIKGGVITGTVTTQVGDPVVGVRVRARIIPPQGATGEPFMLQRLTDDRGVYRIYGLPAGTYVVWAGGGGELNSSEWDPYDGDVPTYAPSSSRDTAAEITVQPGVETGNIDIRYRGEPGRTVSGTVTGGTEDLMRNVAVHLTSAADGGASVNFTSGQSPDASGFVFFGLDDGEYNLIARTYLASGEWALSAPKRIRVRGEDISGVELSIKPLASIKGQVVLEELKTKECVDKQRPVLTETQVSAWHKDDEAARRQPRFVWSLGAPVNADAQGNITLRSLAAGDYYFMTRFTAKSWYLQSITLPAPPKKAVDATRVWTSVKGGDRISGLTVTLAEGAASVAGRVVLSEGEALAEKLVVYLVPAEKEKADEVLRFYAAPVGDDGKFAVNNVAPGRYLVLARSASDGVQTKYRLPDANEIRAQLRREAEAGKTEIELKPCQSVVDYQLKMARQ